MAKVVFKVPEMSCEHCVRRITQVLANAGYEDVKVSLPEKLVTVETEKPQEIMGFLEEIGYPASVTS